MDILAQYVLILYALIPVFLVFGFAVVAVFMLFDDKPKKMPKIVMRNYCDDFV